MQQAALSRRERQVGEVNVVFVVLGFVCVNQRDLGETLGLICANRLSPLACYSPADYADHAEEYSKAVLFRRERQVGMVYVFLGFGVRLRRSAGDIGVSSVLIEYSCMLFSRRESH